MSAPVTRSAPSQSLAEALEVRPILAGAGVAMAAWLLLKVAPQLEIEAFARVAASLAGLLSGRGVMRIADGWLLPGAGRPVVVTAACSATGYFLILCALLGWRLSQRKRRIAVALGAAIPMAFALAVLVNSLRVVALVQAHRWVIPRFPESYGALLHMLAGVAVFLPALIALNLLLETYGRSRSRTDC